MHLHNRINKDILKEKMRQSGENRITLSFYKYFKIPNPQEYRDKLYQEFSALGVILIVSISVGLYLGPKLTCFLANKHIGIECLARWWLLTEI